MGGQKLAVQKFIWPSKRFFWPSKLFFGRPKNLAVQKVIFWEYLTGKSLKKKSISNPDYDYDDDDDDDGYGNESLQVHQSSRQLAAVHLDEIDASCDLKTSATANGADHMSDMFLKLSIDTNPEVPQVVSEFVFGSEVAEVTEPRDASLIRRAQTWS